MLKKRNKAQNGFTLIEAGISIAIVAIIALGMMSYRYYSVIDVGTAEINSTVSRVGVMLLESWHGANGSEDFTPILFSTDELIISEESGPDEPQDFIWLGSYHITVPYEDLNFYATLSWNQLEDGLRVLNVSIVWPKNREITDIDEMTKSFKLSTLCRN